MLLIDGVRYDLWTPPSEDEFERVVREHAQDIFGERSEYFDIKHKLKSRAGKGSVPDGFAIVFAGQPCWHIVEIELSSHAYEHIAGQVSKFINGITNATTQKDIVDVLYNEIDSDEFRKLRLRKAIGTTDTHKFLADLISQPAMLTIIIEKHTEDVDEALNMLAYPPQNKRVVEFQTLAREGAGLAVHAHLFEPLYEEGTKSPDIQGRERGQIHEGNKSRRFSDPEKLKLKPGEKDKNGYGLIEREWVGAKCISIWVSPGGRSYRVSWDYDDYHGRDFFKRLRSEDEARRRFQEILQDERKTER